MLGLDGAARAQAAPALRRPAPARGDGPRDRPRPEVFLMDEPLSNLDATLRVQMRAEIVAHPARARRDDDLRHARPGGGDDDGRPGRRHAQRRAPAGRRTRRRSTTGRPTCSSRASSAARAMNLVQARLDREDGALVCRVGGQALVVPADAGARPARARRLRRPDDRPRHPSRAPRGRGPRRRRAGGARRCAARCVTTEAARLRGARPRRDRGGAGGDPGGARGRSRTSTARWRSTLESRPASGARV